MEGAWGLLEWHKAGVGGRLFGVEDKGSKVEIDSNNGGVGWRIKMGYIDKG